MKRIVELTCSLICQKKSIVHVELICEGRKPEVRGKDTNEKITEKI